MYFYFSSFKNQVVKGVGWFLPAVVVLSDVFIASAVRERKTNDQFHAADFLDSRDESSEVICISDWGSAIVSSHFVFVFFFSFHVVWQGRIVCASFISLSTSALPPCFFLNFFETCSFARGRHIWTRQKKQDGRANLKEDSHYIFCGELLLSLSGPSLAAVESLVLFGSS